MAQDRFLSQSSLFLSKLFLTLKTSNFEIKKGGGEIMYEEQHSFYCAPNALSTTVKNHAKRKRAGRL